MEVAAAKLISYWPDMNIVREDGEDVDILAKSKNFLAYFRRGRSVYKGSVSGSQYEAAKIIFAEIPEDTVPNGSHYNLKVLLETPIRR